MKAINLNDLAKKIACKEGKKVAVDIAQIKEVQRLVLEELACTDYLDVLLTLRKVGEKMG